MTHLLDTCICVFLIRDKHPSVRSKFRSFDLSHLAVSSISEAELRYGASKSMQPSKNHALLDCLFQPLQVLPFDHHDAAHYGDIRQSLEKEGVPIGPLDLLIAAHARAKNLVLVTNNTKEFLRVPGLRVEDWFDSSS